MDSLSISSLMASGAKSMSGSLTKVGTAVSLEKDVNGLAALLTPERASAETRVASPFLSTPTSDMIQSMVEEDRNMKRRARESLLRKSQRRSHKRKANLGVRPCESFPSSFSLSCDMMTDACTNKQTNKHTMNDNGYMHTHE